MNIDFRKRLRRRGHKTECSKTTYTTFWKQWIQFQKKSIDHTVYRAVGVLTIKQGLN